MGQTSCIRHQIRACLALVPLCALLIGAAPQAKRTWLTYPMPPKIRPADPMRISPGAEIPQNPERFTWRVTAPKNDPKVVNVPVYSRASGRFAKIGSVPVGTTLTLDKVAVASESHYYAMKFTPPGGKETTVWINGYFIAPTALASDK